MQPATRRQLLGVACLVAVAGGAALLFSPARVVGGLENLATRPLLFFVALAALYVVRPFLLWPVSSIAVVLGYVYGPTLGLPVALAGAGLSGLPPFLIARYVDSDAGLFGSLADSGEQVTATVGEFRGVLAGRFSPVPGDVVSYAAGLSGVSIGAFVTGTLVGEVPWALVAVLAGNSMRTLSPSGFALGPNAALAIGGLAVIVLAGPVYSHLRGSPSELPE
jgi:uncharacterized membrane protein YdjX (TVP38/TMEM64 family)